MLVVNSVFQRLTRFEPWNTRCGNLNHSTGLWIATRTGGAIFHAKSSKADQSDRVAIFQCTGDGIHYRVQRPTGSSFRNVRS